MSTAQAEVYTHRFTRDEYHKLGEAGIFHEDERVELINGEIVHMTPIGRKHSGIVDFLAHTFWKQLNDKAIVRVQNPIVLNDLNELQPDLLLLKPNPSFYQDRDVMASDVYLIGEVSDSTLHYDRETKLPLYAQHNIPEVWIVDVTNKRVERYHTPKTNTYIEKSLLTENDFLRLIDFPQFKLLVCEIFRY